MLKTRNPQRAQFPSGGRSLTHLATRILHAPLLIHPEKLEVILAFLGPRFGMEPLTAAGPSRLFSDYFDDDDDEDDDDGFPLGPQDSEDDAVSPDVLVIPVHGTLVKRSSWMDSDSGLCSYASVQRQMQAALDDPNVTGIVLDVDSPGGESCGMFDLSDWMYSVRGQKPVVSISNDQAYSAGYCLASCADKMLVTSVGGAGSIGCWMLHCDQSGWDKEHGLKFTYVYAGAKKVEGNPHQSLSKDALSEWQQECDRVRMMFVQAVARNRSVSADDLYSTEAGCYMGADCIPMLADGVGTLQDAVNMCRGLAGGAASRSMPKVSRGNPQKKAKAARPVDVQLERHAILEMFESFRSPNSTGYCDYQFADGGPILALRKFGTAALAPSGDVKQAKITGVLAPYGALSCDLGGFKEIFTAGCFSESLKDGDERVLFNHNIDHVLGRKSAGTARFWDEPDGLHYDADLPDTQAARDLKASMERGDIRESSAAFYILSHHWETRGGWRTRVIDRAKLVEGSPHSFAAYDSTTATVEPVSPAGSNSAESVTEADYELELIRARHEMLMVA